MPTSRALQTRSARLPIHPASVAASVLLWGSSLLAAPPSPPPSARPTTPATTSAARSASSKALNTRAYDSLRADELAESLAALRALQAVDPSLATSCNLGLVARRLGHSIEAAENLSRCVMAYHLVAPSEGPERAKIDELAGELAMARASVAAVRLDTLPGASITIDGRPLGPMSRERELFVEPGFHVFIATSGKNPPLKERVYLARGDVRVVALTPPPPPPPRPDRWPAYGWVATAVTGGTSLVLFAASAVNQDVASAQLEHARATPRACSNAATAPPSCKAFVSAQHDATLLGALAIGSVALSGALAVATTIYIARKPSKTSARASVGLGSVNVVMPW